MAEAPGGIRILPEDQPPRSARKAFGGLSLCSHGPEHCFQEHRASWTEEVLVRPSRRCGAGSLVLWPGLRASEALSPTPPYSPLS